MAKRAPQNKSTTGPKKHAIAQGDGNYGYNAATGPVAQGGAGDRGRVPADVKPKRSPKAKADAKIRTPVEDMKPAVTDGSDSDAARLFVWPARGPIVNGFDDVRNKGIDIGGASGERVLAAAPGLVAYAGNGVPGYGNLIMIKHDAGYLTAYAHNRALLVKEGDTVIGGQKIAEMGNTDADRVMLHFEIRKQGKPVDPIKYLLPQ